MRYKKSLFVSDLYAIVAQAPSTANARTPKARKLASGNPAAVPLPPGGRLVKSPAFFVQFHKFDTFYLQAVKVFFISFFC